MHAELQGDLTKLTKLNAAYFPLYILYYCENNYPYKFLTPN